VAKKRIGSGGKDIKIPSFSNRTLDETMVPYSPIPEIQNLEFPHEKNISFKIVMVSSGDPTECPVTL